MRADKDLTSQKGRPGVERRRMRRPAVAAASIIFLLSGVMGLADPVAAIPDPASVCNLLRTLPAGGARVETITPAPNAGEGAVELEVLLIDAAIAHHLGAITLAQVAREEAEYQALQDLASTIVQTHSVVVQQLRAWRGAWFPDAPTTTPSIMTHLVEQLIRERSDPGTSLGMLPELDTSTSLVALCRAPEPFDRAFLDAMIKHHTAAIILTEVALGYATHVELRDAYGAIISAHQRELKQMSAWRSTWFGNKTPHIAPIE
ncbi:MAG: DUF305 domain-containing protein [Thermomicrobiales bacterium]|nr:DUF305 domain-containing protein [Thermomicrobiales bacterium]